MAVLLAMVAITAPAPAAETAGADRSNCPRKLERAYSRHYRRVARRHGQRAPGRNIRRHGVLFRGTVFDAVCSELRRSDRQLKRLLTAPAYAYSVPVPPPQPPAGVRTDATAATLAGGGSSNPMVSPNCESGGNPQAVSPGGQYWGKYQFDYGTWAAHGGDPGAYGSAPEWVQDQIAARVQYDAWPNC